MRELSIFVDEPGDIGPSSENYLIALVFHDQENNIAASIGQYQQSMRDAGLDSKAFHFTPITRGHAPFDSMDFQIRKKRFSTFRIFAEQTDFRYLAFAYKKREIGSADNLASKMHRDISRAIRNSLEFFQSFDVVKIYYDNGQRVVKRAIHSAIEETISKEAIVYRNASPASYYLFQVADYVCGIELTAIRYQTRKTGGTEERFFGEWINFKKNYLKKIRKKRIG